MKLKQLMTNNFATLKLLYAESFLSARHVRFLIFSLSESNGGSGLILNNSILSFKFWYSRIRFWYCTFVDLCFKNFQRVSIKRFYAYLIFLGSKLFPVFF